MAAETTPIESTLDPDMYDELAQKFFEGKSIGAERYFDGSLDESRRVDIEDSYGRYKESIDALFPDQDESIKRKILAVCTFFERMGCESGIVYAKTQMNNAGYDSDASFRHRVTEYGLH